MTDPRSPEPPVRLGGVDRRADGSRVLWSVAEGRRGRRWRANGLGPDGTLRAALLLEVDRDGRPVRLELSTAAGLLTLHPEPDFGAIHGNVVGPGGVRPLAFGWSPDHALWLADLDVSWLVLLARLAASVGAGEAREVPALAIGADLRPAPAVLRVVRLGARRWRVSGPADGPDGAHEIELTGEGTAPPAADPAAATEEPGGAAASGGPRWPLEDP